MMVESGGEYSFRQTYVALRWALIVVVGMLLIAIIYAGCVTGYWQTSISAYYYTAVRPTFVAALCAIGACVIVYHASNPENVILDVAGFLAFVVAFVPTTIDPSRPAPGMVNVPTAVEVTAIVRTNLFALLVAGILATAIGWALWRRTPQATYIGGRLPHTNLALFWFLFALVVGVALWIFASTLVDKHAHYVAAVAMFCCLFFVVVANAREADAMTPPRSYLAVIFKRIEQVGGPYRTYVMIARLMLAAALVLGLLGWAGFKHWIFWVELVLISLFAGFWQRQTRELLEAPQAGVEPTEEG